MASSEVPEPAGVPEPPRQPRAVLRAVGERLAALAEEVSAAREAWQVERCAQQATGLGKLLWLDAERRRRLEARGRGWVLAERALRRDVVFPII